MSRESFFHEAQVLKYIVWPQFTFMAEVNGEPAGFMIIVPDFHHAFKAVGNGRLLSDGTLQAARREEAAPQRPHHDPRRQGGVSAIAESSRCSRTRCFGAARNSARSAPRRRGFSRTTTSSTIRSRRMGAKEYRRWRIYVDRSERLTRYEHFRQVRAYTTAREVQAIGSYPYFTPIEETTATEARIGGEWKIMVGSNNYLGLTHHPKVLEAARARAREYGSGSTGSRFLNGTLDLHYELEATARAFFNKEAALVFTTGYQASLGALAPLVGRGDHMFLDRLDHASLVDGARLVIGEMHRYPHGDFDALDRQLARIAARRQQARRHRRRVLDGRHASSICRVSSRVAQEHGAQILVDEAHALGVLGADGAGTASHFGMLDDVDLILATFSKSLASVGGVVAGPAQRHSLAAPPQPRADLHGEHAAVVGRRRARGARQSCRTSRSVASGSGRTRTRRRRTARARLRHRGDADAGDSGADRRFDSRMRVWRALFDDGVFTHPIIPPAVSGARVPHSRVDVGRAHARADRARALGVRARGEDARLRGRRFLGTSGRSRQFRRRATSPE